MKKIALTILSLCPVFLLASGGEGPKNFDILERTVNFLIIFGILFYLVKNPVKNAYNGRIKAIEDSLNAASQKLTDSKLAKEQAVKDLETAKARAINLIEIAKKESVNIQEKVKNSTKFELELLEKSFEEQKQFEERKMKKAIVSEILNDVFSEDALKLDQKDLINLVQKKVG